MLDRKETFTAVLKHRLTGCGYEFRGGGIYTRGSRKSPMDWLSIAGNRYFCVINAGVVFPKLNIEFRSLLPLSEGASIQTKSYSTLLPFVFYPIQRYVSLPTNLATQKTLTPGDAEDLANIACGPLLEALSPFHSVQAATAEVRATLGVGQAKSFLLVLAYLKQGQNEAAKSIAQAIQEAMTAGKVLDHYRLFLRNLESRYGVNLLSAT